MNDFIQKFSTYGNAELLNIIEHPESYQPQAVEAAQQVISARQLSEEDLETAKGALKTKSAEAESGKQELSRNLNRIKESLIDSLKSLPILHQDQGKTILIVSLLMAGLFVSDLYRSFDLAAAAFTDPDAGWFIALFLIEIAVQPIAILLFYRRRKKGWLLLVFFLTFSALHAAEFFMLIFPWQDFLMSGQASDLFRRVPVLPLMTLWFHAGMLWVICKSSLREAYFVDKSTMQATLCISTTFTLLLIYLMYY